ncbi:ATP-binding cassette domain-containing protein [Liquorilactobacillus hordei]|uniref:ATP-binding cassette domain-containing protein n=1 Tax=Liquorilactobacillus hordei TaxID=468911 RepID=UPI001CBE0064|nr:ATP-binding cassette domain-containing protein [Liquorilactobacillus hordei]MBZ2405566.1 hypothetical protein [Liquorilactobacillus hordei]
MTYTDLVLSNITYSYEQENILENIKIKNPLSGIIQIKGENGIVKPTLINIIIGLLKPDHGEVNFGIIKDEIGYATQEPLLLGGLTIN